MLIQYENFLKQCSNHNFTEESYMEIRQAFDKKLPNGLCWKSIRECIEYYQQKNQPLNDALLRRWLQTKV